MHTMKSLSRVLLLLFCLLTAATRSAAESDIKSDTDSVAVGADGNFSEWVNMRSDNPTSVMKSVWSEINFRRCLEDYRTVSLSVADSLEANKKPDETVSAYETPLNTLTRMINYEKFHAEDYSPRLTIYFYASVALFLLMLLCWLVRSFVISPLTLKFKKP